jgi:hypothetical protein
MKTLLSIALVFCFAITNLSADNGDNGMRMKKMNFKKIADRLDQTQDIWKFVVEVNPEDATLIPEDLDMMFSIDNTLPSFNSKEDRMSYAKNHKKLVLLTWMAPPSESTFVVERSVKGLDEFIEVGKVEPAQRNSSALMLTFMDTSAPYGLFVYRVVEKQGDKIITEHTPQAMAHFVDK